MIFFRSMYRIRLAQSFRISVGLLLLVSTISVKSTVDLGLQVVASNGCIVGTVFQPSSCTRCVCAFLNFMLCREICSNTPPPENRPTGPTIVPILMPSNSNNNRQQIIQLLPTNTILQLLRPIPS